MGKSKTPIENDIIKKYRKELWGRFVKGIKQFNLLTSGDRVLVAISGGKDSFLMAKLFQELTLHPFIDVEVVFLTMNPGYSEDDLHQIKNNAKHLGIDLIIEPYNIFKVVNNIAADYPCYMCARMRRGFLYSMAEKYRCNKLALGHHYNDVIETTMLNLCFAGTFKTMVPKHKSQNFKGIDLIRPMYFIKENDIEKIMSNHEISVLKCGCDVAAGRLASKRTEIKELIKQLKTLNKDIEKSLFRAAANVNLDHVLGWEKNGVKYTFDDD